MARTRMPYVDDARAVGVRLREAREQARLSQRQLAFAGCSAAYISRIEAGERVPSLQLIHELANRLRISAQFLARGIEVEEPEEAELVEAEVALRLGELDKAEQIYRARLDGSPTIRVRALAGMGQIALRNGDIDGAVVWLEEVIAASGDHLLSDSASVDALGRAYALRGELESAISLFEKAYAQAQDVGAPVELLRFSVLLANARADNGQIAAARSLLAAAIKLASDSQDPLSLARVYWTQSRVHVLNEEPRLALEYAKKALVILERTENDAYIAMAYHLMAYVEIEGGNPEQALALLATGRKRFGAGFASIDEAKFSLEEARAHLALGKNAAAAKVLANALPHLEALEPPDRGRAYSSMAEAFAAAGDRARAAELYETAIGLLERYGKPYLVETARRFADLLEDQGDTARALQILKSAVAAQSRS